MCSHPREAVHSWGAARGGCLCSEHSLPGPSAIWKTKEVIVGVYGNLLLKGTEEWGGRSLLGLFPGFVEPLDFRFQGIHFCHVVAVCGRLLLDVLLQGTFAVYDGTEAGFQKGEVLIQPETEGETLCMQQNRRK